ncbi:MAG: site-specific DNA-methyltransferase [Dehalococcoidia bacterium]|nr:site-specific DNA-methyltransferase [Dehalococcoidia bacterium]
MSPKPKKPTHPTPVEATKHHDTRLNIPTAELRDFAESYEASPGKLLYPRDPSLDPQLVWKGKDEQDRQPLEVPVVPIYIQESVQPRAIIENVRAQARKAATAAGQPEQLSMDNFFGDFNGLSFDERVDFYQHEQDWTNRMVLGDSLLVMASLAEKEGLKGKVQMIYMDPPYGIKFGSNWQVSTRKRDVRDGKPEDMAREPEVIKAFRDTWELGIHSYLAFLRDRFAAAHELLTETGSIFVQIGDENLHLVRTLLDEAFGSENFVSVITVQKMAGLSARYLNGAADYILWYARSAEQAKYRQLFHGKVQGVGHGSGARYDQVISPRGDRQPLPKDPEDLDAKLREGWRVFQPTTLTTFGSGGSSFFPFLHNGRTYYPSAGKGWLTTEQGLSRLAAAGRLVQTGQSIRYARMIEDFPSYEINNVWTDIASPPDVVYVVQTSTRVIDRCILMTTDPGDLVLDPTCGSGTTAYAAEQWGRRWITMDTSRVALALARTRLMSARYPYYVLADSREGVQKEADITGQTPPQYETRGDIKKGFVYKRVPHITLKSIANNPDITEGMTREEIDAAIQRYADTEVLYDQPYEDNKRIRVAGPFTVESLSPHRVLSADEERPESEREAERSDAAGGFEVTIIDNLRKAGVQNTKKNERLAFDSLDIFPGVYIDAAGQYTDKAGVSRRVAVSIGPQYGAVGSDLVKDAAKEALKGAGFDLLVVCGFAFDAHAGETAKEFSPDDARVGAPPGAGGVGGGAAPSGGGGAGFVAEETKQYGKLPVMLARMNLDLTMGDEVLKKTGTGNLFMVFGEPDVSIERVPAGARVGAPLGVGGGAGGAAPSGGGGAGATTPREQITVEVRGVDVYDPTTGQIRASSTDDIACWFIDTNYNGESFFVRHAYFCGDDEPYDKLKRALRAEVDEAAWSTLYSTRSYPFDPPETGKIAVKVINHYGDEVLKVYEV